MEFCHHQRRRTHYGPGTAWERHDHARHRQHHGEGAPLGRRGKRRAETQAIGRSRGGRTTRIHLVVDGQGRPIALAVTPDQLGDMRAALPLLASIPPGRLCLADTAYHASGLRQFLVERGTLPVIPNDPTRKRLHPFDRKLYRARNRVERAICRLKDRRRVATRYDKHADIFLSAVALAAVIIWWT